MLVILYNFHYLTSHSAQMLLTAMKYYLECVYKLRRAELPAFKLNKLGKIRGRCSWIGVIVQHCDSLSVRRRVAASTTLLFIDL